MKEGATQSIYAATREGDAHGKRTYLKYSHPFCGASQQCTSGIIKLRFKNSRVVGMRYRSDSQQGESDTNTETGGLFVW